MRTTIRELALNKPLRIIDRFAAVSALIFSLCLVLVGFTHAAFSMINIECHLLAVMWQNSHERGILIAGIAALCWIAIRGKHLGAQ